MKLDARVEKVTPELAEEWLGKNTHNRNIRARIVDAYARDMEAGRWRMFGEAVKFSANGTLLDGQHRLHAIVRAGVPVEILVVRGLEAHTQEVMDSGSARTAGDALRLRGHTSQYAALAAAARICIRAQSGLALDGGAIKVTTPEALAFIEANPDLLPAVEMASAHRNAIDVPQSVLAYAIWVLSKIDLDACNLFITKIADKTFYTKGDPILALNNRLTEIRRNGRRATRSDFLSLVFRAWNHWCSGKQVQNLPLSKGVDAPIDIPEPVHPKR